VTYLKNRIVSLLLIIVLFTPIAFAQQTNSLTSIRQVLQKQEQTLLTGYGKSLDSVMSDLKKKGDLDAYLVVETEKKRFEVEKTVPTDAKDIFKILIGGYHKARVKLLKQYIVALDNYIKVEMRAGRIDGAKEGKVEKDRFAFELADLESNLPKELLSETTKPDGAGTNTVAKATVSSSKKPIPEDAAEFKGHHYAVIIKELSWDDAKKACENEGGHLVIITSTTENEFCLRLGNGRGLWIGCSDDKKQGDWRWVDGSKVTSFGVPITLGGSKILRSNKLGENRHQMGEIPTWGWLSGQPNNSGALEHYGAFVPMIYEYSRISRGYGWNDVKSDGNSNEYGFGKVSGYICEWDK